MKKVMNVLTIFAATAVMGAGTAWAKDAVVASVTIPADGRQAIVVENGTTQSQGTYAIGTIHVLYTFVGFEFPTGDFAVFNLGLGVNQYGTKPATVYPVNAIELDPTAELILTPQTSSFVVSGPAWTGATPVTVTIPAGVSNEDGATLTGKLNVKTPGGAHLDSATDIVVKIKLVHPTSCLKVYDFVTDTELETTITAVQLNVNQRKGTISSSNPGQLSNNVLVVNACAAPETFDAQVSLDPYFNTNPFNNPGNAVFTFFSATQVTPENYGAAPWSVGTPQGQQLCLANVTVPSGSSWLATVKTAIQNVAPPASGNTFLFTGLLRETGTPACAGAPKAGVSPNPAEALVTFTVK